MSYNSSNDFGGRYHHPNQHTSNTQMNDQYHHQGYSQGHHHHSAQYQEQQYQQQGQPPLFPPLYPGWEEARDPTSGKPYYYNSQTGETQWDRPSSHIPLRQLPPPPPPSIAKQNIHQSSIPYHEQYHAPYNICSNDGDLLLSNTFNGSRESVADESSLIVPSPHDGERPENAPALRLHSFVGIKTAPMNAPTIAGETGNLLLHATSSGSQPNVALLHSEKLVAVAREVLHKAGPDKTVGMSEVELYSLTAGQVADLCKLQRRLFQEKSQKLLDSTNEEAASPSSTPKSDPPRKVHTLAPYTPINPFTMPLSSPSLLERTEQGRLDVRLHSLRKELMAFGYNGDQS